jgi:hypothetical protein
MGKMGDYYIDIILELEDREAYLISLLDRFEKFSNQMLDNEITDAEFVSGLYLIKETQNAIKDYNEQMEIMKANTKLTCFKYSC